MCQFVKFLRSPPSRHHISLFKFTNSARAKVKTFTHFNKKSNTETLIFAHNPHFVQQIPHRPLTYRIYRIYRGYSNYPTSKPSSRYPAKATAAKADQSRVQIL